MDTYRRFRNRHIVVLGEESPLAQTLVAALQGESGRVVFHDTCRCDLPAEPETIDILFLVSAPGTWEGNILDLDEGNWSALVTGPADRFFRHARPVLQAMRRTQRGVVVFLCPVNAAHGSDADSAGSVLHGTLRQWARCLAVQAAPDHIRCNTVLYGNIEGDVDRGAKTRAGTIMMQSPYLPGPGGYRDAAEAALFLASEDAKFLVGSELRVDGGAGAGIEAYGGRCSIGNAIMENMLGEQEGRGLSGKTGSSGTATGRRFDLSSIDLSEFEEPPGPQTVLVTGVSKGLGRALVEHLIEKGHTVLGCARSEKAMAELRERFAGTGAPHRFDVVDLTDRPQVLAWAETLFRSERFPDFLINNAATIGDTETTVWKHTSENFEQVLKVNVMSMVNTIHAFVPTMLRRKKGVIVNFSSGWGREGGLRIGPYATSKWAVEGLSRVLAAELPTMLCCVSLHPGIVQTESMKRGFGAAAELYATPEEWARVAVPFLLSLDSRQNGRALTVPGMSDFLGIRAIPPGINIRFDNFNNAAPGDDNDKIGR